jgi:hypothetical protein
MNGDWKADLEKAFESRASAILRHLELAREKFKTAEERHQVARRRKSRRATAVEKFLIQVVSNLYYVEKAIRKILRRPFTSEFLGIFQELTSAAFALVIKKFGEIQIQLPLAMSRADGTGGLTVGMLLSSADRQSIESLLPNGLELIPHETLGEFQNRIPPGHHPIMIGLGFNSGVGPVKDEHTFVKMKYLELTFGIPAVQVAPEFGEPSGPFFYIPGLYLNAVTPTLLGWAYGFKKTIKRFRSSSTSYSVASLLLNQPLLAAEIIGTAPGSDLSFATDIPDLAPWLDFLDQPIITRTWWGKFRCTFFHWDWFYTPALAARVDVKVFSGGLPLLRAGHYEFGSPAAHPSDPVRLAYLMSVPWRLILPFDRAALKWTWQVKYLWPFRKKKQPARGGAQTAGR